MWRFFLRHSLRTSQCSRWLVVGEPGAGFAMAPRRRSDQFSRADQHLPSSPSRWARRSVALMIGTRWEREMGRSTRCERVQGSGHLPRRTPASRKGRGGPTAEQRGEPDLGSPRDRPARGPVRLGLRLLSSSAGWVSRSGSRCRLGRRGRLRAAPTRCPQARALPLLQRATPVRARRRRRPRHTRSASVMGPRDGASPRWISMPSRVAKPYSPLDVEPRREAEPLVVRQRGADVADRECRCNSLQNCHAAHRSDARRPGSVCEELSNLSDDLLGSHERTRVVGSLDRMEAASRTLGHVACCFPPPLPGPDVAEHRKWHRVAFDRQRLEACLPRMRHRPRGHSAR